jgi:hypothetical protein
VRLRDTVDQAFEPEPPEIAGHLGSGKRTTQERFHVRRRSRLRKPLREMGKGAERREECHHGRVAGDALAGLDSGTSSRTRT